MESVTGATSGLVAVVVADLRFSPRCGQCLEPVRYRDTRPVRRFRHVPMWGIPVELRYEPRRVSCPRCAGVHVEAMPWVSGKQRMTRALVVTLATWTRLLPWEQVARLFHCAWGTVATAVEEAVVYGLANRDLEGLTHIGIDEISRKRGHVYVTNVYDLERKRLVWSGEGRKQETLEAFFDYLGPEKTAALEGICCDMWQPYIDVIKDRAPQAVLVFDKFHIVRHLMEAVDQVRRDEIREKGSEHKALMYKTRFIWLKNPWNLTEGQAFRLGELERLNLKINRAYLLKELFRHFWDYRRAGGQKSTSRSGSGGHPFQTTANAQLRLDGSPSRRRHPQLLQDANRQRHRRRAEQQSEARHPQGIRIPHRQELHPKSLPLPG